MDITLIGLKIDQQGYLHRQGTKAHERKTRLTHYRYTYRSTQTQKPAWCQSGNLWPPTGDQQTRCRNSWKTNANKNTLGKPYIYIFKPNLKQMPEFIKIRVTGSDCEEISASLSEKSNAIKENWRMAPVARLLQRKPSRSWCWQNVNKSWWR